MKHSRKYLDLVAAVIGAIPSVDVPAHAHLPAHVPLADLVDVRALALACEDEIIASQRSRMALSSAERRVDRDRDREARRANDVADRRAGLRVIRGAR